MHVCLVYDCLYPWTIGGAEKWYRELAAELVRRGHEVTYQTRQQWDDGDEPEIDGVDVVAVSRSEPLYGIDGRRRAGQALRFGAGVGRHLARHRRAYDVVHLCSFPYFSLLAARAALVRSDIALGVDWFEVWSRSYWREYLGGPGGHAGAGVQWLCARLTPAAFVFSDLHADRLRRLNPTVRMTRLSGLHAPDLGDAHHRPEVLRRASRVEDVAVFAGRHIAEKRAHLVPAAIAAARREVGGLRGVVFGDGPERERVLEAIAAADACGFVTAPGFVDRAQVMATVASAACLVLPSTREGYGLVVIEAAAAGTPSVVVDGADNAAAELVVDGVNGVVARDVAGLGDAIARAVRGGEDLRARTRAWYVDNATRLSIRSSAASIATQYELARGKPRISPRV